MNFIDAKYLKNIIITVIFGNYDVIITNILICSHVTVVNNF